MNYAINELFKINDQIDKIDALLEISYREKELEETRRNSFFHTIIGIVSVILSMSYIFEYIIKPIYDIRFSKEMSSIAILKSYGMLLLGASVILISAYYFIVLKKKANK